MIANVEENKSGGLSIRWRGGRLFCFCGEIDAEHGEIEMSTCHGKKHYRQRGKCKSIRRAKVCIKAAAQFAESWMKNRSN